MSFVLDNSVTMLWCFGDGTPEDLDYAAAVARQLQTDTALVPVIWVLEVVNVLARGELLGQLAAETSSEFLEMLKRMRIVTDPDTTRHAFSTTLDLARRHRLSAYDAAYLELAQRKQIPLATLDADLRKSAAAAGVALF